MCQEREDLDSKSSLRLARDTTCHVCGEAQSQVYKNESMFQVAAIPTILHFKLLANLNEGVKPIHSGSPFSNAAARYSLTSLEVHSLIPLYPERNIMHKRTSLCQ